MSLTGLMTHRLAHSRPTRTSDGQGGWTTTWTSLGTLRGRLSTGPSAGERTVADQERAVLGPVAYFPGHPDVRRGDRLTLDGVSVDVISVRDPSRAGRHLECACEEVQIDG